MIPGSQDNSPCLTRSSRSGCLRDRSQQDVGQMHKGQVNHPRRRQLSGHKWKPQQAPRAFVVFFSKARSRVFQNRDRMCCTVSCIQSRLTQRFEQQKLCAVPTAIPPWVRCPGLRSLLTLCEFDFQSWQFRQRPHPLQKTNTSAIMSFEAALS